MAPAMRAAASVPFWLESEAGLLVALKVQPGARRARLGPVVPAAAAPGWPQARLRLAVVVPPEDGRANDAVLKALAAWLGVGAARLALRAGGQARDKLVLVVGGSAAEFAGPLAAVSGAGEAPPGVTTTGAR